MTLSDSTRLWLYVVMGVGPIWQDFFTKSTDYSFRGLMMPVVSTLVTASAVILAKTSARKDAPTETTPVEVVNTPANPLPVTETATTPAAPPQRAVPTETKPLPPKSEP